MIVGYQCTDILSVADTQGQTCAWYDIGTNSDNCGAYDRIFQARTYDNYPTGTAVWNSETNSYDYVQNNVVAEVPAFTAATTCCSCGKPDTPITEFQHNKTRAEDAGLIYLIYIVAHAAVNTLAAGYFFIKDMQLISDVEEYWPYDDSASVFLGA